MSDQAEDLHAPILPGRGASDYERYLRTDELLSLQKPADERVHRDELLFQTVHQTSELWLKLASAEVEEAAELLERDDPGPAAALLRRAVLCMQFITAQLEMLGYMNPWDYERIRFGSRGHGAGFDSPGFREVARVTRRIAVAFDDLLERAGVELVDLYTHRSDHEPLYVVAELLTDWDERVWVWRFRHYNAVARAIGEDTIGTQGTPVQVLGRLIAQRGLPKLWDVRSRLAELYEAERERGSC